MVVKPVLKLVREIILPTQGCAQTAPRFHVFPELGRIQDEMV